MDPIIVGIVAVIVGVAIGVFVGRSGGRSAGLEAGRAAGLRSGKAEGLTEGREEGDAQLQALIDAVSRGRVPEGASPGSAEARLHDALVQGWAPRETEREAALREAVERVSSFLTKSVRDPLAGASERADAAELRERIARALGALEDLDFFIAEVDEGRHGTDLGKLVQGVSREFATDHEVGLRLMLASTSVRAEVNPPALMDALYLVLHNASRFGGGTTIDLGVEQDGDRSKIVVRDRGKGFSEEAFARAFDPFYSTSDAGLGLGLPHARKVIEWMGGDIELRNVPDGGAEVEISFPAA